MAWLLLHGIAIETVFDLLGRDENDMTLPGNAVGRRAAWVYGQSSVVVKTPLG